jgi:putative phosphoribosyl transferase
MTMRPVQIRTPDVVVDADVSVPDGARALVIFAHGSGSSRHSSRNRSVARALNAEGLATLLLDLLTEAEERIDVLTSELRFDIDLLSSRVIGGVDWAFAQDLTSPLPIGIFGASTGAAAALVAAAERPELVYSVVSRGGRPDLAGRALERVMAPTLLIVGSRDQTVIEVNRQAMRRMTCEHELELVPGATHLFEEPGTLDVVAHRASDWYLEHLPVDASPQVEGEQRSGAHSD